MFRPLAHCVYAGLRCKLVKFIRETRKDQGKMSNRRLNLFPSLLAGKWQSQLSGRNVEFAPYRFAELGHQASRVTWDADVLVAPV